MRIGRDRGFTLVEMIVAVVITATLGFAIYTTFSQGVRIWTRAAKDHGEWKVDLWVEGMTEDLRNAFQDSQRPMKGNRTGLSFMTLTHEHNDKSVREGPVYSKYGFDAKNKTLIYQKIPFENVLLGRESKEITVSELKGIVSFDLEYYVYDPKLKAYRWVSQWNKDCFPETVKITIEPEQMNRHKWIRMVRMPTGSACPA